MTLKQPAVCTCACLPASCSSKLFYPSYPRPSQDLADVQPEEQRVCRLVHEAAASSLAGSCRGPFALYLVGSRAIGEASPRSDFDFVIDVGSPLPGKIINPLREALHNLPVPYGIDLVDWHETSASFREPAGPQRVSLASAS